MIEIELELIIVFFFCIVRVFKRESCNPSAERATETSEHEDDYGLKKGLYRGGYFDVKLKNLVVSNNLTEESRGYRHHHQTVLVGQALLLNSAGSNWSMSSSASVTKYVCSISVGMEILLLPARAMNSMRQRVMSGFSVRRAFMYYLSRSSWSRDVTNGICASWWRVVMLVCRWVLLLNGLRRIARRAAFGQLVVGWLFSYLVY